MDDLQQHPLMFQFIPLDIYNVCDDFETKTPQILVVEQVLGTKMLPN